MSDQYGRIPQPALTKKQNRLERRMFLRQSAASLLAAGLWPGALTARAEAGNSKAEPFDFVVVNDTHYRDARCGEYLTRAFEQIQSEPRKPELILLAGDLATDGRKNELGPMKDIISSVKCPVHVTPGNHDYKPDKSGKQYDAIFPKQRNYVVEHKGWTILCYDSTLNVQWNKVAVQPATLAWLDITLPKLEFGRPMIVFTHFPLGNGVNMRSTNADAALQRFEKHNLRAVFTGHFHGLTEKKHGNVPICGNRCLALSRGNHDGSKEKGYFSARAQAKEVSHEFREFLPAG
jgi:3',5'-cyclic AMP phosphodiesterase CpdA